MSIKGVTYSKQTVSAADHAALFQSLLSDGILYGCSSSFNRDTYIISAGAFVIAGRMTKIEGSYSIKVPDSISDQEVRVIGVCDMAGAATENTFGQFYFEIQQKVNDAYPSLVIQDVNTGDPNAKYQIEWARLTIGTQGLISSYTVTITDSESQQGGGNSLTTDDFEFANGASSYEFTSQSDDWMMAFLATDTFTLKKKISNVDLFVLSAGENANDASSQWTNGGKGGRYVAFTNLTLNKGQYAISIGDEDSADSSLAGGELMYSSNSGNEDDRVPPNNTVAGNGADGIYPWGDNACLLYPGRKFGPSGGNGCQFADNGGGTKAGGIAGSYSGPGTQDQPRPGEGGFIDSTVGNRTHGTGLAILNGWDGGPNTGCGGGGSAYHIKSPWNEGGTGGKGGSGIILMRPARANPSV